MKLEFPYTIREVTDMATPKPTLKRAMEVNGLPIVAATYTKNNTRLCHENLGNVPETTLHAALVCLDAHKT